MSRRETGPKALVGFAGFGGPEIVLREAGIETVGVEIDAAIAEVNRCNGGSVITADILKLNPANFMGYDLFHCSPPCPSYSVARNRAAKQNIYQRISDLSRFQALTNSENETDLQLSRQICRFISVIRPKYFTLENVWAYKKALSFMNIWYTLQQEGYGVDWWHLNAADYGVPQSRKRMIVIARRDGRKPAKPWPTHSKTGDMFTKPWAGWHEAIEDLIPDLKGTQFAPWQWDRLPDELELCPHRAFILGQGERSQPKFADAPADTVTANNNQTGVKMLIIDSANSNSNTAGEKTCLPKAFVVDCQNNGSPGNRKLTIRESDEPIFTMTASANRRPVRACLTSARVILMSIRCLARFQSFPDSFVLPGEPGLDENTILLLDPRTDRELACRGIGNALPSGMYRAVLRSLDLL